MPLTDEQKQQASALGLSQQEARFSLATRIPLTRYAEIKAQIAAGHEAEEALMSDFADGVAEALSTTYRGGRGGPHGRGAELPPPEEDA